MLLRLFMCQSLKSRLSGTAYGPNWCCDTAYAGCGFWEKVEGLGVQEQHAEPERLGRAQQRAARPESLAAHRESAAIATKVNVIY